VLKICILPSILSGTWKPRCAWCIVGRIQSLEIRWQWVHYSHLSILLKWYRTLKVGVEISAIQMGYFLSRASVTRIHWETAVPVTPNGWKVVMRRKICSELLTFLHLRDSVQRFLTSGFLYQTASSDPTRGTPGSNPKPNLNLPSECGSGECWLSGVTYNRESIAETW